MGMAASLGGAQHGTNYGLEDTEVHIVRCKPEGLDALCRNTKFSRKELQVMYRGFKQECPSGIVDEETFKCIYAQFFPQGDTTSYAHHVFKMFDQQNIGTINFEDFVMSLSILARGSLTDKLQWVFRLYDVDGDGVISRDEMLTIILAVHAMMGKHSKPGDDSYSAKQHVDMVFQKMDADGDGVISKEEFLEICSTDNSIVHGVMALDTHFST